MSLAEKITRARGGDWHGNQGSVAGPGHKPRDRSMSIRDGGPDGVLLKSFANPADELAFKRELRASLSVRPET